MGKFGKLFFSFLSSMAEQLSDNLSQVLRDQELFEEKFGIQRFKPSVSGWHEIKNKILEIEYSAFKEKGYSEAELEEFFVEAKNIIILLKNDKDEIVGYTLAWPKSKEEAYIESTAIDETQQNKKLVGRLIGSLEEELKKRGYKFISRDSIISNGYADKISRFYGKRIIDTYDHDSDWGPQRYFKISL
jgi:hypothetical protein